MHLDDQYPERTQAFIDLIKLHQNSLSQLFLLGDLFEAWIGDDAPGECGKILIKLLSTLASQGIHCYIMHGNRDFLIQSKFTKKAQCGLLADPSLITLNNKRVLLSHGDLYCTDDVQYQLIRKQLRSDEWQKDFLSKSIDERSLMAAQARAESKNYQQDKEQSLMDVNQQAINDAFITYDADIIIHGHTHRPNVHSSQIKNKERIRYVLGDWYQSHPGSYVMANNTNVNLISL